MNLKNIATLRAGHPFRGKIENALDGDVAVVQMKDVDLEKGLNNTHLFKVKLAGRRMPDYFKRGDILFIGRGYRLFALVIDRDLEKTLAGPHFFILRIKPASPLLSQEYLAWYINYKQAQRYFSQHVAGTALPHITRTALENLPLTIPPLKVQENIMNAQNFWLKEKALQEMLIEKKKLLLDKLVEQTLEQYQGDRI